MNTYPKKIATHLGFEEIKRLLVRFCQSEKGASIANRISPTSKLEVIQRWLKQVQEIGLLKADTKASISFEFVDFESHLTRLKVPGTFLDPGHFHDLKRGIVAVASWTLLLENRRLDFPELALLAAEIEVDARLVDTIEQAIDDRGEVRDNASPELSKIRRSISKSEQAVRVAIQKVLKRAKSDEYTDEDSTLTVRDGRLVIPIKAEHKKRIPGFVHDESATGQTVYLEPGEVLDLNNQVQELKYRERREVIKILLTLSDKVRNSLEGLTKGVTLIEKLDLIYAKYKLQNELDATIPEVIGSCSFRLLNARHPSLLLAAKESGKKVIPLNLELTRENRILIISGPNAGGKSVALKTVGLLQYMIQSGLPVPVHEESKMGVFESIFIDIGDTQSIEDDLSTYSAHLTSVKHFLQYANKSTLFLIDEFGKGTEPQFGGAIAASVLHQLNESKSVGIVTTHYQNLKKIGEETAGLINGAMKYDQEALEPLFELEVGRPGSSFAFEIARKIGLPEKIIEEAKRKLGTSQVDYDQLLNELEQEKHKFEKLSKEAAQNQSAVVNMRKEYESLRKMLEDDRSKVLKEAKQEAKRILQEANKDVEKVIREIKEHKASKDQTKRARAHLDEKKAALTDRETKKKVSLKEGDSVSVAGQDTVGKIQKINGKQAEVLFGSLRSIVSVDKLEKTTETPQVIYRKKMKKLGIDVSDKMAHFQHELTIRGMRAEEAMGKVETFLDEALLLGVDQVRIVHGKGSGVLRDLVRNISRSHPSVSSVEDEHADRGGAGISIVHLA
ncbi:MAG: endonuclease MutS2 [Bacteroidota bacterium]